MPEEATPSPCNQVCTLDAAGICIGCGRSLDEIAEWAAAAPDRRREIVGLAAGRRAEMRGG